MAFLTAQRQRICLQEIQETRVQSLDWENHLESEMVTIPVFLPGKSHEQREPGGLQSMGSQKVGHNRATENTHTHTHKDGK